MWPKTFFSFCSSFIAHILYYCVPFKNFWSVPKKILFPSRVTSGKMEEKRIIKP